MRRFALAALALGCLPSTAFAQSALPSPEELSNRDMVTVALGAGLTPDYEGSDDYRLIPVAATRGQLGGISFSTQGTQLYVDVIPNKSSKVDLILGPVAGVRLNRTRKVKDDVVDLLPDRKTAIELGGYAGVSVSGLTNPYDSLAFTVAAIHDVGNAHESTVVIPKASFSTPLSDSTFASLSLGANFVSDKFADYYFSVSPAESALTAGVLPVFDADGGMKDWTLGLLLNQSITGNLLHGFSVVGTASYSHLVGDFKDSPLVSQRGSASQWLVAAGVAYTW